MTHNDRVLAALRTGPKSAQQLYGLGLIAHSRVASLREKGYTILCTRVASETGARAFRYELVGDPLDSVAGRSSPAVPATVSSGAAGHLGGTDGRAPVPLEQLALAGV